MATACKQLERAPSGAFAHVAFGREVAMTREAKAILIGLVGEGHQHQLRRSRQIELPPPGHRFEAHGQVRLLRLQATCRTAMIAMPVIALTCSRNSVSTTRMR